MNSPNTVQLNFPGLDIVWYEKPNVNVVSSTIKCFLYTEKVIQVQISLKRINKSKSVYKGFFNVVSSQLFQEIRIKSKNIVPSCLSFQEGSSEMEWFNMASQKLKVQLPPLTKTIYEKFSVGSASWILDCSKETVNCNMKHTNNKFPV